MMTIKHITAKSMGFISLKILCPYMQAECHLCSFQSLHFFFFFLHSNSNPKYNSKVIRNLPNLKKHYSVVYNQKGSLHFVILETNMDSDLVHAWEIKAHLLQWRIPDSIGPVSQLQSILNLSQCVVVCCVTLCHLTTISESNKHVNWWKLDVI